MSLAEKISGPKSAEVARKPPRKVNGGSDRNEGTKLDKARKYVSKMPPAISGSGGHNATLDVVRACKGFALSEDETLGVLHEYNERCQPPWCERELAHKAKQLPLLRVSEGYILDRETAWEPQRQAARVAMPEPDGPPLFANSETPSKKHNAADDFTVNVQEPDPKYRGGGPAEDYERQQETQPVTAAIDNAIALVCRRQSHEDEPVPVPFHDYMKALDGGLWSGVEVLISTTGGLKTQLSIQKLWFVAKQGIPCLYVTLELTVIEATIRLLAQVAGVSWSTAMKGQLSPENFAKFQAAGVELATLPIEIKRGTPYLFSSADLAMVVTDFRARHPKGRAYAVVDFAQLMKSAQQNAEARERVGQVLYSMQTLAKEKNVVVTAISSTARANNIGLADIKKFADLRFENGKKIVGNPMALLSLGKEAGEVELAAEYQLVMAKWPEKTPEGTEIIIGAIAKYRLNRCKWFAMAVDRGRLLEYPCSDWSDLPEVVDNRGAIQPPVSADEMELRILDFVRVNPDTVKSKTGFRGQVIGNKATIDAAAERLIARDSFERGQKGGFCLPHQKGQGANL